MWKVSMYGLDWSILKEGNLTSKGTNPFRKRQGITAEIAEQHLSRLQRYNTMFKTIVSATKQSCLTFVKGFNTCYTAFCRC